MSLSELGASFLIICNVENQLTNWLRCNVNDPWENWGFRPIQLILNDNNVQCLLKILDT